MSNNEIKDIAHKYMDNKGKYNPAASQRIADERKAEMQRNRLIHADNATNNLWEKIFPRK